MLNEDIALQEGTPLPPAFVFHYIDMLKCYWYASKDKHAPFDTPTGYAVLTIKRLDPPVHSDTIYTQLSPVIRLEPPQACEMLEQLRAGSSAALANAVVRLGASIDTCCLSRMRVLINPEWACESYLWILPTRRNATANTTEPA
jgi:hypothetical protein